MPGNEMIFSIIIVNYNSGDLLEKCVSSIVKQLDPGYEIVIYDNASSDDSVSRFTSGIHGNTVIRFLYGKENLGFAKANNLAAREAKGRFFHFLNPDIIVNEQLRKDYRAILVNPGSPVTVTSLVDENGNLQKNRHIIPTIGNYFIRLFKKEKTAYWTIGASVIMHRDAFHRISGWPEDYFMYAEDLDLFYMLYKAGISICYLDTRLMHVGKGSTRNIWTEQERLLIVERSFKRFYKKQGFLWQYYLIRPILLIFILFHESGSFGPMSKTFLKTIFTPLR